MLEYFKPTWMVKSIYSITPEQLRKNNIHAVLTDLDNTLIAWDHPEATEESVRWIEMMKEADIPVVIISNNNGNRIEKVAEILELDFVPMSLKPSRRAFRKAEKKLGIPAENLVMVGDQIMTDILGSNRHGVRSILVKPILDSDAWNTKFNRFIELKIMNKLIKSDPNMEWGDSLDEPIREP
ncbi:MAG TPA: YqeG family HAD IIIA-type phosphatase [Atopostipes sp.]|jgi:HAD superfamily (subfamily IIIA) phosphatase, TIGR01668|nr:YqeG family HAD IIIA-type phosphatase [Atopostipes sp.]